MSQLPLLVVALLATLAVADQCSPTPIHSGASIQSSGRIFASGVTVGSLSLVAGGSLTQGGAYNYTDVFDWHTQQWLSPRSMARGRWGMAAAAIGELAFLAGGAYRFNQTYAVSSASIEVFNASTGDFIRSGPLSALQLPSGAITYASAAAVGPLAIFAGSKGVDIFDTRGNNWFPATTLPNGNRDLTATASTGNLAIFAGGWRGGAAVKSVDIFDVTTWYWRPTVPSMNGEARSNFAGVGVGSLAVFGGGHNGVASSAAVDIYDSVSNTFRTSLTLYSNVARYNLAVAAAADRFVIFAGGRNETMPFDVVDILDVVSMSWVINTGRLQNARAGLVGVSYLTHALFASGGDEVYPPAYYPYTDVFDASCATPTPAPSTTPPPSPTTRAPTPSPTPAPSPTTRAPTPAPTSATPKPTTQAPTTPAPSSPSPVATTTQPSPSSSPPTTSPSTTSTTPSPSPSVPTSTTPASSTDPVTEAPFTEAKAKAKALNVGKLVAIVVPSAVTVAGITALAVLWFLGYLTKWHQKCIHVEVPGDA